MVRVPQAVTWRTLMAFFSPFLLVCAWLLCSAGAWAAEGEAPAQDAPPAPRFFLLTIGPGDAYWSVWGHTALLVSTPDQDDFVYSFGHFDFNEERFFVNFLKGRMRYFLDRAAAGRELSRFVTENRDIWVQPLSIPDEQARALLRRLQSLDTDTSRHYDYDYFLANCTSKVRDLINDSLSEPFAPKLHRQTGASWGELTLPVPNHGWMNLALYLVYGWEAWRPRDAWQAAVFPLQLKDVLTGLEANGRPIAQPARQLYSAAPRTPGFWRAYGPVLGGVLLFLLGWSWSRTRNMFLRLWLTLESIIGWLLVALWVFTDHWIAAYNPNILLMFPFAWRVMGRDGQVRHAWLMTYVALSVLWIVWAVGVGVLYLLPWSGLNLLAAWLLWAKKTPR